MITGDELDPGFNPQIIIINNSTNNNDNNNNNKKPFDKNSLYVKNILFYSILFFMRLIK